MTTDELDELLLDRFGLRRTESADAPARYRDWLDGLQRPAGWRSYPDLEAVAARLMRNNPRLSADKAAFHLLLAHQPKLARDNAAHGVDLQISGHTHGGQMWPFHYVVRAVQPSLAGLSTVGHTQLYVTRGVGFWGPPVRLGAQPDITVLSLAR